MGEGKEITVMRGRDGRSAGEREGRELGIIGIDNPHNVSVSRMNAHFPICVVSPRERERERERGRERRGGGGQKNAEVTGPNWDPSIPLFSSLSISVGDIRGASIGRSVQIQLD